MSFHTGWVNMSRHGSAMTRPVYLQQRTYLVTAAMAVECQKPTLPFVIRLRRQHATEV